MKKKIIFRSGSLRMGGLERILIEVLQTIDKSKYDITLIIDDDCGEKNIFEKDIPKEIKYYFLKSQELIKKTEYYKDRKSNIFCKLMYNLYMNLENFIMYKKMKEILKKLGNVDLLIDFDAGASKYIEKLNIPYKVVWIHNSIPKLKKKESKIRRFGKRLQHYDKVVAICDEMKEELQAIYPYLKNKVVRIYNPFNFDRILNLSEDYSELSEEDLELIKKDYCLAISRLDEVQKDYNTLLQAFKILKEKGIFKQLYIIGDGPDRKKIENWIKEYGLEDRVKLLGQRKNPYVWLKNANCFVHSSKYEGLPTVLIEALICDKLVISSNCPTGPKEILERGESGILFEVGDYKGLASILQNYEKDKYIDKILNRKNVFNKNLIIKEYEKLIDSFLENNLFN